MRVATLFVCFFVWLSSPLCAQPCASLPVGTYSVCEDFSATDLSNWTGDAAQFTVNAAQQLQSNGAGTDTSSLSIAANLAADITEWHIDVQMTFAPSDNNQLRWYLMADQANLEGSLNGYFLEMGENGSADAISLFRQDGEAVTLLVRGPDGIVADNPNLGIKVTRTSAGEWAIFTGPTAATAGELYAKATDNTYNSANFFTGVWCKYTSSNADNFFFDNFYVGNVITDTTAPEVVSTTVENANTLTVCFSEQIGSGVAEDPANYTLNGSVNPINALSSLDETCVTLTFAEAFSENNTLQIANIPDVAGNVMTVFNGNFTYFVAQAGDVLINEIFADPTPVVGLPDFEFIELYNNTDQPISLNGWGITDNLLEVPAEIGNVTIAANGFLILTSVGDAETAYSAFGPTVGISDFPSITNTGETLSLISPTGAVIHSVTFSTAWYNDAVKDDGGWTLERIDPEVTCDEAANWTASINPTGGTPGAANSVLGQIQDDTCSANRQRQFNQRQCD